ncbi:MAG: iron dicitrate transport regulator FecR [Sphingomonas sp.]|nr:MAG: iron dicitrate transport regulator FecR [Sphingomonas sp.]
MTTPPDRSPQDIVRLAEASAWRVRLTEDGLESCEAFEDWRSDPDNAAAWEQVDAPWRRMGEEATSPELMAARVGALQRARRAERKRRTMQPHILRLVSALAVAFLLLGVLGWRWVALQPDVYLTGPGERRVVKLVDGSIVSLDSTSEVRVHYTDKARQLTLVSGQARFDVAHNADRPFTVKAGAQTVVATGTAFNIDKLGAEVLVTLLEGRVTVLNLPAGRTPSARVAGPMALAPGQQVVIRQTADPEVKSVSASRATAWETGQLIFEDEPLSDAVARVARYGGRRLSVEGKAADLRISGVFKAGDTATFIDAVSAYLPVEATADASGAIMLRSRS